MPDLGHGTWDLGLAPEASVSQGISLEQAQAAVAAAIEEAGKDGRGMAAAIVDEHGDLICCARNGWRAGAGPALRHSRFIS